MSLQSTFAGWLTGIEQAIGIVELYQQPGYRMYRTNSGTARPTVDEILKDLNHLRENPPPTVLEVNE